MSFPLKGPGIEGSGPGLVRVVGSFAITASAPAALKPSKGNFTVTRKAAGVYVVQYAQAALSVAYSDANVGPAAGVGTGALITAVPAYAVASKDFLDASASNFVQDISANGKAGRKLLVLVFNAANNALADVPANYRCAFEFVLCTSAMNT